MSDRLQPAVDDIQKHQLNSKNTDTAPDTPLSGAVPANAKPADWPRELGGPKGPEPTRYGDWEHKGRCSDF